MRQLNVVCAVTTAGAEMVPAAPARANLVKSRRRMAAPRCLDRIAGCRSKGHAIVAAGQGLAPGSCVTFSRCRLSPGEFDPQSAGGASGGSVVLTGAPTRRLLHLAPLAGRGGSKWLG